MAMTAVLVVVVVVAVGVGVGGGVVQLVGDSPAREWYFR